MMIMLMIIMVLIDDTPLFSATTDVGNYNDVYDADGVDDVKVK